MFYNFYYLLVKKICFTISFPGIFLEESAHLYHPLPIYFYDGTLFKKPFTILAWTLNILIYKIKVEIAYVATVVKRVGMYVLTHEIRVRFPIRIFLRLVVSGFCYKSTIITCAVQ